MDDFFGIDPEVNQLFQFAQRFPDPLALDLDGDGIETIAIGDWQSTVLFDHDADGQRTGTGWVHADDGLLVRDLDGNGTIDSGRELFGDQTRLSNGALAADAFAALADLDGNQDGRIDANDAAFAQLQVWQDRNQDGISQADELTTLSERGIQALSTQSQASGAWINGSILAATGEYTRADGTIGATGGLAFSSAGFFSTFTDSIPLSEQVLPLPDMHGSGQVRDLRQAASLSSDLAGTLQALSDASLHSQQWAMMDGLLSNWAATSGMQTMEQRARGAGFLVTYRFGILEPAHIPWIASADSSTGTGHYSIGSVEGFYQSQGANYGYWMNLIGILERFVGEEFIEFVRPEQPNEGDAISVSNPTTSGSGYGSLLPGDRLYRVEVVVTQAQLNRLQQAYNALKTSVFESLVAQTRMPHYLDEVRLHFDDNRLSFDFSGATARLATIFGIDQETAIHDAALLDRLHGSSLNQAGWDPLVDLGGLLRGADGINTAGQVALAENSFLLVGAEGVGQEALQSARAVFLREDAATFDSSSDWHGVRIYGGGGDNSITGGMGDDLIYGGAGNDLLLGGTGNDTLIGGAGNDRLEGGSNEDRYHFGRGDGQDHILDQGWGYSDTLVFGPGITFEDLALKLEGNDLILGIRGAGSSTDDPSLLADHVRIDGWLTSQNRIEWFEFADGTRWEAGRLYKEGLPTEGTAADDNLMGSEEFSDRIYGLEGNDGIYGQGGNDDLIGGTGDDALDGGNGNDSLYGGDGNDTLDGGTGADLLDGGAGDDMLGGEMYGLDWAYSQGGNEYRGGLGNDLVNGSFHGDTYRFERGDGQDSIREFGYADYGQDRLLFGAGIAPTDVTLSREGQDLLLALGDGSDQIRVLDAYAGDEQRLETVEFSDGSIWDKATLHDQGLERTGTAADDIITGAAGFGDRLQGLEGNDILFGLGGDDDLNGGEGDDELDGADGNDILEGATGADFLNGGNGNDTLHGGDGNDRLDGGSGADLLDGGAGDDMLGGEIYGLDWAYSQGGNDYRGALGNDRLNGSLYGDVYRFDRGDGQDGIREFGYADYGPDRLLFGTGIATSDVSLSREGQDLLLTLGDGSDQIRVLDAYLGNDYRIDQVEFSDGTVWGGTEIDVLMANQVDQLVSAMAAFGASSAGETLLPGQIGEDSQSVIAASWQPA